MRHEQADRPSARGLLGVLPLPHMVNALLYVDFIDRPKCHNYDYALMDVDTPSAFCQVANKKLRLCLWCRARLQQTKIKNQEKEAQPAKINGKIIFSDLRNPRKHFHAAVWRGRKW